jgi:hypothetical protein
MNPNYKGPKPSRQFTIDCLRRGMKADTDRLGRLAQELAALQASIKRTHDRLQELLDGPRT